MKNWKEIRERFLKLYVPAVADVLDEMGYEFQVCASNLRPLEKDMKLAGPAFTIKGQRNGSHEFDMSKRIGPGILDHLEEGCVAVNDTSGDPETGHRGELWSGGAMARGCVGCLLDGGIRDTAYIIRQGFPMYYKYISPNDAMGRFSITEWQTNVTIGGVIVHPGDYIFGDYDGVVVIPKDVTMEVLEKAEKIVEIENSIRAEVKEGASLGGLYIKYGRF